jgi:hypothetical protein
MDASSRLRTARALPKPGAPLSRWRPNLRQEQQKQQQEVSMAIYFTFRQQEPLRMYEHQSACELLCVHALHPPGKTQALTPPGTPWQSAAAAFWSSMPTDTLQYQYVQDGCRTAQPQNAYSSKPLLHCT